VLALHEGSPGKGEGPGAWRRESADARTWHLMGGADDRKTYAQERVRDGLEEQAC